MTLRCVTLWILIAATAFGETEKLEMPWKPESTWRRGRENSVVTFIRKAEVAEGNGDFKKARKWYEKIESASINTSNRAKAIIAQGLCLERLGKPALAVRRYQRAIDNHTNVIPFLKVLELEYNIANQYYDGLTDDFLFFSFKNYDLAIDIYDHIAQHAQSSPLAAESSYRSGILCRKMGYFEDSIDKFKDLIARHSRHKRVNDARLELAHTLLIYAADADGDGALVRRAKRQLNQLIRREPNYERLDEAKAVLTEANRMEAARLLYLGEFYQREAHSRLDASRRYLNQVVDDYDDDDMKELAENLLYSLDAEPDDNVSQPPQSALPTANESTPPASSTQSDNVSPKQTGPSSGKWLVPIDDLDNTEVSQ